MVFWSRFSFFKIRLLFFSNRYSFFSNNFSVLSNNCLLAFKVFSVISLTDTEYFLKFLHPIVACVCEQIPFFLITLFSALCRTSSVLLQVHGNWIKYWKYDFVMIKYNYKNWLRKRSRVQFTHCCATPLADKIVDVFITY